MDIKLNKQIPNETITLITEVCKRKAGERLKMQHEIK